MQLLAFRLHAMFARDARELLHPFLLPFESLALGDAKRGAWRSESEGVSW